MRQLGQMNPRNYREWSADVNLISNQLSISVADFPYRGYTAFGPTCDLFCALFYSPSICLIANNFS